MMDEHCGCLIVARSSPARESCWAKSLWLKGLSSGYVVRESIHQLLTKSAWQFTVLNAYSRWGAGSHVGTIAYTSTVTSITGRGDSEDVSFLETLRFLADETGVSMVRLMCPEGGVACMKVVLAR